MKNKWLLFAGLGLLTIGIVFRILFGESTLPVVLIGAGVFLKIFFVIRKMLNTNYRPGYELIFLFVGLALFFSGMYLEKPFVFIEPVYLKFSGIFLKILFVWFFIRKARPKQ